MAVTAINVARGLASRLRLKHTKKQARWRSFSMSHGDWLLA